MNNNFILYQGLFIFRNAVLPFIVGRLQEAYGKGWWKAGVQRALGESVATSLERQFERRYGKKLAAVKRPGSEVHDILDIGHFLPIIQRNWKRCFADVFEQQDTTEVWLREIIEVRNAVAHPESEPLSDDDTWRAFDTMVRLVQPIDSASADQIVQVRQSVQVVRQDVPETTTRPLWLDLREGPYDYAQGLTRLQTVVLQQEGQGSEIHLRFERHRDQLIRSLWERKSTPGVLDGQLENRFESILEELDRLAIHYLSTTSFYDLCIAPTQPQPTTPKDALTRIRELEQEIEDLQNKLYRRQWKKLAQTRTGEIVPQLERDIARVQEDLDSKRSELDCLMETAAPSAFFSVQRKLEPNGKRVYVEEQLISVSVEISNQGLEAVGICYDEGLPESFELVEGSLHLEERVEAGNTVTFSYCCYPTQSGKYRLSTTYIEYQGQISGWDRIEDTNIEVRSAKTEPDLTVNRYYHFEKNGLNLLVHLENKGAKIAHNVRYKEKLAIPGQPDSIKMFWEGTLHGDGVGHTVEKHLLAISNPEQVHFSKRVEITYHNSQGLMKSFILEPTNFKRIEYQFPVATDTEVATVGRGAEIQKLSSTVEGVWRLSRGQAVSSLKRILLIKGIEGTGKTRLVYELVNLAEQRGFVWHIEDAKDRSPVKRMLRRLIGLRPDEDNDKVIWGRLEETLSGAEHNLHRDVIFRFISTIPVLFDENELAQLKAGTFVLMRTVCQRSVPTLLVFENIHWTPEGAEEDLLLALLHNALVSRDNPLFLCATYRPGEIEPLPVIDKLRMSRAYYELLELESLSKEAIRALVDEIVDFPRFSEPLYHFVENWAGNPLYSIELLRLLTHPDGEYLTHIGGEWYPAPGMNLKEVVPKTIDDVILERVERELSKEADLARTLSAIGFELPLKFIEALMTREFPRWSSDELHKQLDVLEQAGILSLVSSSHYEFEHQLKREVLYASLPKRKQPLLRQKVAEVLLNQEIFTDPEEQTRQLARHLVKSPREFQVKHLGEIRKAAELERGLRNFSRSLEFYDAAIEITPEDSFETACLLVERSRLYQLRGDWIPAESDLKQVYQLVSSESALVKTHGKEAAKLRISVQKEQGRVMLNQPQASLDRVNNLLYHARKGLEGTIPFRRFFLPNDFDFHRDLMEIYLALAEVWLRKREFKVCEKTCRRAERIATSAMKRWPKKPLVHEVYRTLGNLYFERGVEQGDYEKALNWYELALQNVKDDRYQQERIWSRLADVHRALGDVDLAYETYDKAIQVQKQLGDTHGLALSFGGIGDLLVEQGQFEQGRYYCEQAYEYQQLVSDLGRFWRTCVSLVKIYLNAGNVEQAAEYWFNARAVLFAQQRFDSLRSRKQQEIYELVTRFVEHFRGSDQLEELRVCLQDLDNILPLVRWERDELANVQMALGETCFKTRRWQEAIDAFTQVLELAETPASRAEALEWLGDVYTAYEPSTRRLLAPDPALEEAQDQAERHYEEAVKLRVRIGDDQLALVAYEKLLNRIVTDETSLLQLPFTFLRILRMTSSQQVCDQFVGKATELLLRNKLPVEAGDIVVYTAREVAKAGDHTGSLDYLHRAEALYRQGKLEDIKWGLNMLIPTYFRLGLWDEVTRCFGELFELTIQVKDADEFIGTYRALGQLRERIDAEELEHFTDLALSGQREMYLSSGQRERLSLHVAKCYLYITKKFEDTDERKMDYEDLALEYYERIIQTSAEATSIVASALHDSATIYSGRKIYEEALQRYGQSIQIFQKTGSYLGACYPRIGRASIHIKMKDFDKALSDYEQSLEFLQRQNNHWSERLQHQDQHPLTPMEIVDMRYDKRWLAGSCEGFAHFLLSSGNPQRAQELAQQASQVYYEIEMTKDAERAQEVASLATLKSGEETALGSAIHQGWHCPSCGEPIIQGMTECPSCTQAVCPECGAALERDAVVCPKCGAEFDLVCPQCDVTISPEDEVCPNCGLHFVSLCPQCGEPVDLEHGLCSNCGQAVCPQCGAAIGDEDEECRSCGAALALFCPECGGEVSSEDIACPYCGESFDT